MLEFNENTYLLEYQDGAYLCNGKKRVEAPLNLETLEEAVKQCPKLQDISLYDAPFGDQCFSILAKASRLDTLALIRGMQITGHGLELLKELPLKYLFLQRTDLDDEGLFQAAQIKKLENLYIAACHQVTFDGLMAISWRDKLCVHDVDQHDDEGRAGLFTAEQRKAYEDARTYKNMKNQIPLDSQELQDPINALQEFFDDMTRWEQLAEKNGCGNQEDIDALFAKRVSWKPRPGWRPVHLSWCFGGTYTYTDYRLIVGERVTKSKYWIYAEESGIIYSRFLLRFIDGKWMIDNAQRYQQGRWAFCGL
ncbi:MAG: RhsIA family immunity protein [Lachnospiraceae bacterium]|nr:RhsIA family immunity protein [Lachnospiraceae bacterium]